MLANKGEMTITAREKSYWRNVRRRYGVERGAVLAQWDEQRGCCCICGNPLEPLPSRQTHIDHDHQSGEVRGLLCTGCNGKLGWFEKLRPNILAYVSRQKETP